MVSAADAVSDFGVSISDLSMPATQATVRRIVAAYRAAVETPLGASESMWLTGPLFESKQDVHDRLVSDDPSVVLTVLSEPGSSDLLYGFEDNTRTQHARDDQPSAAALVSGGREQLLLLAEAVGAARLRQPGSTGEIEGPLLLDRLDAAFGFRLAFPNPWPGEAGLETGRGILTYRATQALYQAWRLRQLATEHNPKILEIGAGSGRTAFYAWQLGIRDYTIVRHLSSGRGALGSLRRAVMRRAWGKIG